MGWSAVTTNSRMRAFIVCLAIAAVAGDAKPYTVAQVEAGLPVKNAFLDGRLHNVGVITNAAEAGVKTVGALPVTAGVYSAHPYGVVSHAGVYAGYPYAVQYGKREAEPYTLAQVALGQTAGGVVTGIDYGHGTGGLRPATAVKHVVPAVYASHVPAVYSAAYTGYGYPYGLHYGKGEAEHQYGKREAEPYTLAQVALGQTAGGVVTGIDYGHGTGGLRPATAVKHVVPAVYASHVPAVYSAAYTGYGYPYGLHYGKGE